MKVYSITSPEQLTRAADLVKWERDRRKVADFIRAWQKGYGTKRMTLGLKPEQARTVLPQSTKAELVMTGTLGHWDHFFDMRARQTTGPAHPQAAEVAIPLMQEMAARFPDVIRA